MENERVGVYLLNDLNMLTESIIAIDIGGTNINFGLIRDNQVVENNVLLFDTQQNEAEILAFIVLGIKQLKANDTVGIAVGVPSIVDVAHGIVFDTLNIPAWQEYALKSELTQQFNLPIYINNDVNFFVVGEHKLGAGRGYTNVAGLCLGTGLGVGLVLNNECYTGSHCCAGEIGGINYLTSTFDDYCSGQFFIKHYQKSGQALAELAYAGDENAELAFQKFGTHLASAIKQILFMVDPQIIIIGGAVAKSFDLFIGSVWQELESFPYQRIINQLVIEKHQLNNSALLGAAYLSLASR